MIDRGPNIGRLSDREARQEVVLVREQREQEGEKIQRRRGRGLCSSESCWEQIRRHGSRRD